MCLHIACGAQQVTSDKIVGGPCEGCEALLEYGKRSLLSIDTISGYHENSPKLLITGTIFQNDGVTPADNIILYIYHTDRAGLYVSDDKSTVWSRRHGKHRGWIRTDKSGHYQFYTFRPAAYPNGGEAEHIHMTVKEPGLIPYYIDNIMFADDMLLTDTRKQKLPQRGGSGIVAITSKGDGFTVSRNIILGKNIPGY